MKIIGISGLAGAGKDLFFELCKEELSKKNFNSCRVALADKLKEECKEACLELFDIDPLNCDRQQKDKIRDFLVFFGLTKRLETEGTHWTSKANLKIKELSDNCSVHNVPNPVCFVTDIRYAKYPKDEHRWIKDQDGNIFTQFNTRVGDELNAGSGTAKFIEGQKKWNYLIGAECLYSIRYLENRTFSIRKCKVTEDMNNKFAK